MFYIIMRSNKKITIYNETKLTILYERFLRCTSIVLIFVLFYKQLAFIEFYQSKSFLSVN